MTVANVSRSRLSQTLALLVLFVDLSGCVRSCKEPRRQEAYDPNRVRQALGIGGGEPAGEAEGEEHEEEREIEDERRERRKALASLAPYRAESCAEAIGKMEAALRGGQGRWLERDSAGAIPEDLMTPLIEAELWRDQATSICEADSHKPRFDELRRLMDGIWRYPVTITKDELEKRLAKLSG